ARPAGRENAPPPHPRGSRRPRHGGGFALRSQPRPHHLSRQVNEAAKPFIGTWMLLSCEHRLDNGTVTYPMGKQPQGLIIYSPDGYMSAALMKPNRPEFQSMDLYGGTNAERAAAMDGYLHYAGRYEIVKDTVVHLVELSLFPNWIGTQQIRYFKFN